MSTMLRAGLVVLLAITACALASGAERKTSMPETDTLKTSAGEVKITFLGHASLMFQFGPTVVHVDPVSKEADYSKLPKADVILVTHEHYDHLDPAAIKQLRQEKTVVIVNAAGAPQVSGATVMKNGETRTVDSLQIEAVPAYNLVHKRPDGQPFHPKGVGNGYVIIYGDARIYVAGDTENTPEMKALKNITVAFLPMNLPYTMTPEMVADAARAFKPKILYPYHTGDTNVAQLVKLLKGEPQIEVRVRRMP